MQHRFRLAVKLLVLTVFTGVLGYRLIGGPRWSLLDCLYMTVITITTVGFGETHDMSGDPMLRAFTILLILCGFGTMTFAFTTVTTFLIEGELNRIIQRRRMSKGINELENHVIVCGAGRTGVHVIRELEKTQHAYVVIDHDHQRMERLLEEGEFYHIVDDPTDDAVLGKAGVERAAGLVSCLPDDKDNIFVTISARHLNPRLRIVAKSVDLQTRHKLLMAGASAVVSPHLIGGLRLASEMIRPDVVSFLDQMMRSPHGTVRIEEVLVAPGSALAGQTLAGSRLRERTGALVLAIRAKGQERYHYNPPAQQVLEEASTLVVLGEQEQVEGLRRLAGSDRTDPIVPGETRAGRSGRVRPVL